MDHVEENPGCLVVNSKDWTSESECQTVDIAFQPMPTMFVSADYMILGVRRHSPNSDTVQEDPLLMLMFPPLLGIALRTPDLRLLAIQ